MKRQMFVKGSSLGLLLFVFTAIVPAVYGQSKDSAEVSGLFSEAKSEAVQLKHDAEELKSYTRSKLHWSTHSAKVNEIKEHVNKSGELLAKMQNARATASPWQQQTIDRIDPMLRDIAATVTATINHLEQQPIKLQTAPYKEYVDANAELTADLAEVISDYVDYGKAKNKSEELADKLEVPGN